MFPVGQTNWKPIDAVHVNLPAYKVSWKNIEWIWRGNGKYPGEHSLKQSFKLFLAGFRS